VSVLRSDCRRGRSGQPKRPETATEVPRLVLAGDWIETGLPAAIEGAAASGRLAADSLS